MFGTAEAEAVGRTVVLEVVVGRTAGVEAVARILVEAAARHTAGDTAAEGASRSRELARREAVDSIARQEGPRHRAGEVARRTAAAAAAHHRAVQAAAHRSRGREEAGSIGPVVEEGLRRAAVAEAAAAVDSNPLAGEGVLLGLAKVCLDKSYACSA